MSGPLFPASVTSGGFVFVSGQASVVDGVIVRDGFEPEMRRAMANFAAALAAAGLGLADVVQVRAYLDDPADLADYNRIYLEYFAEPLPARTTLSGCLGGVVGFEIDGVARKAESA